MKPARSVVFLFLLVVAFCGGAAAQKFGEWSAPVNLRHPINTAIVENAPVISKNGLSLFFEEGVTRTPNHGGRDMWVAHRETIDTPWSDATVTVMNVGTGLNSSGHDQQPAFSPDEHLMYFASTRSPSQGFDIFVSRRHNRKDDFGWQTPVNLGPTINTASDEDGPAIYEDESSGKTYLYFASNRNGNNDIFVSEMQSDGSWGSAEPVSILNSARDDYGPFVTKDGLELYFVSNRDITRRGDIYVSRRGNTSDPWPSPVNLGPTINSAYNEVSPVISFDGTVMYFGVSFNPANEGPAPAGQPPQYDIWMSTRPKLTGQTP